MKEGKITKPLIAWCIGTCAKMFTTEVQFGHAGALAQGDMETADYKNKALRDAGAMVPDTFEDLPNLLDATFKKVFFFSFLFLFSFLLPPFFLYFYYYFLLLFTSISTLQMVLEGKITLKPEPEPPKVPLDFAWAKELGLIRKPANFVSSICDDRGQELVKKIFFINDCFFFF